SASGAFFSCVRLSAMILVECKAAVVKVEYWTISRCTCAPLLCSMCLKVCNSVMSLSISCTEVVVALQQGVDAAGHHLAFVLRLALPVGHDVAAHEFADLRLHFRLRWLVVFGGVTRFAKCHV